MFNLRSPGWRHRIFDYAVVAAALAFLFLWMGDISFLGDEALGLYTAMNADAEGRLLTLGGEGTSNVRYGPVPLWFYQLCLLTTSNFYAVIWMKAIMSAGLTLAAGLGLARLLRLPVWPLAILFISPYFRFYHRIPWEALLIPFSFVLAWSLVSFLHKGGVLRLSIGMIAALVMLHTHLMCLPIVAAWGAVLLIFGWRRLLAIWPSALAVGLLAVGFSMPYAIYFLGAWKHSRIVRAAPLMESTIAAFEGLYAYTWDGFIEYFTPQFLNASMMPETLIVGLKAVTMLGAVAVCVGIGLGISRAARIVFRKSKPSTWCCVSAFCLIAIILNWMMMCAMRIDDHPHYANAMAPAFFILLWRALSVLQSFKLARPLLLAYLASLATLDAAHAVFIHENGGCRSYHYGTTFSEQTRVCREILAEAGAKTPVIMNFGNPESNSTQFTSIIHSIRLSPSLPLPPALPAKKIVVEYADSAPSAWLVVKPQR